MLRRRAAMCVLGLLLTATPVLADQHDPALDQLFMELRNTRSPEQARVIEQAIAQIWATSNSDAIDYLMRSGEAALEAQDFPSALAMFSGVTEMAPDFVEGWSQRAKVHYLMDDSRNAVAAIQHVLALEPRQFAALYGLAGIFDDWGEKKRALEALDAARAIDPHIEGVDERLKALRKDVEGQGI